MYLPIFYPKCEEMQMKKLALLSILTALLGATASSSFAAEVWYEVDWMGNRTISVEFVQPVEEAYVHITGIRNGKCTPPNSNVRVMRRDEAKTTSNNYNVSANAGRGGVGVGASMGGNTSYSTPQVYRYSFHDLSLSQVHYNVMYVRNGKSYSVKGWSPTPNHCTYYVPSA